MSAAPAQAPPPAVRRLPRQKRARERFDRILDATAALFDEVGVEGITTNHIANRAGVDIGSVYYFFRDKFQIFDAILRRDLGELRAAIEQSEADPADGPDAWIERLVDVHWAFVEEWQSSAQLFESLRGRAETIAAIRDYDELINGVYVEALKRYAPGVPASRRRIAALVLNETLGSLLHTASLLESKRDCNAVVQETRTLLRAYLAADRTT